MRRLIYFALVAQLLLVVPSAAEYLKFNKGMDLGFAKWILLFGVLGGLAHLTFWMVTKQLKTRAVSDRVSSKNAQRSHAFEARATALGFRQGEARTIERIAMRLSPKSPLNLLNSANGREYLVGDLDKRIAKRQREVRVLEKLKSRLAVLREQDVHERETPRIEANLAVWVLRRRSPVETELFDDEDSQDGDGDDPILENLDSIAGRLIDISEGGAAIAVDMNLSRGDRIQFWSADNTWILGETRAGVLSTETRNGETVLHVYFVDPDLRELRPALSDLRARSGADPGDDEE